MRTETMQKDKKELDLAAIRADFPILDQEIEGRPLVYFDNAATTQKPRVVMEAIGRYYGEINSNVHRGVHHLSQKATDAFESAREVVRAHLNAAKAHEIIFVKGVTDGINLVAHGMRRMLKPGDEILISTLEHHSNIVPWQMLCEESGAHLKVIPINQRGELDLEAYRALLNNRTRMVAVNHVSNALGTVNPVKAIAEEAHRVGAWCLIDGAQSLPHMQVDVRDLDADFYVFSGHKVYGPTGIGVLYGKEEWLEKWPPYQGGGEMIAEVTFEKTTYAGLPHKFEAGTPNIAGAIVLATALGYLQDLGLEAVEAHEAGLLNYATEQLKDHFPELRIFGEAAEKASVVSFLLGQIHPYDAGVLLDKMGVAIRTGHHCTQPLMHFFGIPGTMRASFAFYNTRQEIDQMIEALQKAQQMLS